MLRKYTRTKISSAQRARLERIKVINSLLEDGYSQSEIARKMGISRQAINQLINRNKYSTRRKLYYAIKAGHKSKPLLCMLCGKQKPLQAHHDNYDEPYYVFWYCEPCHAKVDKKGWNETNKNRFKKGLKNEQPKTRVYKCRYPINPETPTSTERIFK